MWKYTLQQKPNQSDHITINTNIAKWNGGILLILLRERGIQKDSKYNNRTP
jgi:hypothetical protein